jgi:hypothetical protein
LTYEWDFADGSVAFAENPSKSYSDADDYTIQLKVISENACADSASRSITIYPNPIAAFNFQDECVGDDVRFFGTSSVSSGTITYEWDFGDATASTIRNPIKQYATAGDFTVAHKVETNFGCRDSVSQTVASFPLPVIDIDPVINTCEDEFLLDAGNAGATFLWQDNSTAQTYLAESSGTYSVAVTDADGCFNQVTTDVTLESTFQPNLAPTAVSCDSITLDAGNAGATSYSWNTGPSTRTLLVTTSGTYSVDIVDQNGCPGSQSIDVTINASPTVDLGDDQAFCSDVVLPLDAGNPGNTIDWSTGENTSLIIPTTTGLYAVTVTTPEGCTNSDEVNITINPVPVVDLGEDRQACDDVILDAANEGATYLWTGGGTDQTLFVNTNGEYIVDVTNTEGCQASDTVNITVDPNPIVELGADREICSGESAVLDAQNPTASFLWSDGSTAQTLEATATGSYYVAVTNSLGCAVSDTVFVTVYPKLEVDLGEDRDICEGMTVEADAGFEGFGYTYQWSSDQGLSATDQVVSLTETGLYWVVVTTDIGCQGVDSMRVNVSQNAINARYLASSEAIEGDTVSFINLSVPMEAEHLWSFGDGLFSSNIDPQHIYLVPGIYDVTLRVSTGVCFDEVTKPILIKKDGERLENQEVDSSDAPLLVKAIAYPNPSEGEFIVDVKMTNEGRVQLMLYTTLGKVIRHQEFSSVKELSEQFDIRDQPSGTYLMRVRTEHHTKTMRIIKR